jgi:hypothetical protein
MVGVVMVGVVNVLFVRVWVLVVSTTSPNTATELIVGALMLGDVNVLFVRVWVLVVSTTSPDEEYQMCSTLSSLNFNLSKLSSSGKPLIIIIILLFI